MEKKSEKERLKVAEVGKGRRRFKKKKKKKKRKKKEKKKKKKKKTGNGTLSCVYAITKIFFEKRQLYRVVNK